MFDQEIKSIGLFFFLALLDDRKALSTANKAVDLFFLKMKKSPQTKPSVAVVSITNQVWNKTKGDSQRGRPQFVEDSGWVLPKDLDLAPWKEFQKNSPEDELLTLIWSRILGISDQDLSLALGLTEGTVRYRVGRAVKKLGGMTRTAGAHVG
jgi:hypothetical protein